MLCAFVAAQAGRTTERVGESELTGRSTASAVAPGRTEPIDARTRDEVLDSIKAAELYVLDVDTIVTHVHAQLDVVVDGEPLTVPQLGVDYDTLTAAPIHTHDETGRLHVEADRAHAGRALRLIDFLRLWAGAYKADDLCHHFTAADRCRAVVTIDGRAADVDATLEDGQRILLEITSVPLLTT